MLHQHGDGGGGPGQYLFVEVEVALVMAGGFFGAVEHVHGLASVFLDPAHEVAAVFTAADFLFFHHMLVHVQWFHQAVNLLPHFSGGIGGGGARPGVIFTSTS